MNVYILMRFISSIQVLHVNLVHIILHVYFPHFNVRYGNKEKKKKTDGCAHYNALQYFSSGV